MKIRPLDSFAEWLLRMPKQHPFWSTVLWLTVLLPVIIFSLR